MFFGSPRLNQPFGFAGLGFSSICRAGDRVTPSAPSAPSAPGLYQAAAGEGAAGEGAVGAAAAAVGLDLPGQRAACAGVVFSFHRDQAAEKNTVFCWVRMRLRVDYQQGNIL